MDTNDYKLAYTERQIEYLRRRRTILNRRIRQLEQRKHELLQDDCPGYMTTPRQRDAISR